jgi:hypothetical protein
VRTRDRSSQKAIGVTYGRARASANSREENTRPPAGYRTSTEEKTRPREVGEENPHPPLVLRTHPPPRARRGWCFGAPLGTARRPAAPVGAARRRLASRPTKSRHLKRNGLFPVAFSGAKFHRARVPCDP